MGPRHHGALRCVLPMGELRDHTRLPPMINLVSRFPVGRAVACAAALTVLLPLQRTGAQPPPKRYAVLAVPAKFATIQTAIDSAVPGDTVLVAPGRYYENIRFKGKGIVVASQFSRTRDAADIERTIIDGSRPAHPDTGTVVRFVNQEDSTAVLEGFTIT